jgi:hypothetical protein
MEEVDFDLTGMAWNEEVGFGLTGMAWKGESQYYGVLNLYLWQVKSTLTDVKQFHHQLFLILPPGNHFYIYPWTSPP